MNLDFTAISGNLAIDTAADLTTDKRASDRKQEQAAGLTISYQREQHSLNRARDILKEYQQNIKASELTRAAIIKGIQAGEPIEGLLLKACSVISLMTGDTAFTEQVKKDLATYSNK